MAKIRNKTVYPLKENPILTDYFIGSDNGTIQKKTVNFEMQDVADLFFEYIAEQLEIVGYQSRITALGTITRNVNTFTFSQGFEWLITGNPHANLMPVNITINTADAGFKRIDIAVVNTLNQIVKIEGQATEEVAIQPLVPENTLLLTTWSIDGETISDPTEPVIGAFVTKQSYGETDSQITGADQLLQFHPLGRNTYRLKNSGLTSIAGFSMQDILDTIEAQGEDEGIEMPYNGKWFLFFNETGENVTIKHNFNTPYRFIMANEQDFVLKPNQTVIIRYKQTAVSSSTQGIFEILGGATVNLATDFSNPNDEEAPTTKAVVDYVSVLIPDGLVSPGIVAWTGTGFVYTVSQAVIKVNGQIYVIPTDNVTLDASDATNPRIDVVYADINGFGVLTGTPASDPVMPQVEPGQIFLTSIIVAANTTEPGDVTGEDVYQENEEYTISSTGTGTTNPESTTFPFAGLYAIETTDIQSGYFLNANRGSNFTYTNFDTISFRIRLKAGFSNRQNLTIYLLDSGGDKVAQGITIQLNKSLIGQYQFIAVPISAFTLAASNQARSIGIEYTRTGGGSSLHSGFYIDDWKLQGGISQPTPVTEFKVQDENGVTQFTTDNLIKLEGVTFDPVTKVVTIPTPDTPTLQEVTDEGNTSTNDLIVSEVFGLDPSTIYGKDSINSIGISLPGGYFLNKDGLLLSDKDGNGTDYLISYLKDRIILNPNSIPNPRGVFKFPDLGAVSTEETLSTREWVNGKFDKPARDEAATPYTLTLADLNSEIRFTSNNQVVNIPDELAGQAIAAGLNKIEFKAHFTGTGTHTINYPDTETWTGEQGALIYALCIDTSGDTLWVVKQFEGGVTTPIAIETELPVDGIVIDGTKRYYISDGIIKPALTGHVDNTEVEIISNPEDADSLVIDLTDFPFLQLQGGGFSESPANYYTLETDVFNTILKQHLTLMMFRRGNIFISNSMNYRVPTENIILSVNNIDNEYVTITFNKIILEEDLVIGNFSKTFTQNGGTATDVTLDSITDSDGVAISGDTNVIRVYFTITGTPDGNEFFTITAAELNDIYGNESTSVVSGNITLSDAADPIAALANVIAYWKEGEGDNTTGTATKTDIKNSKVLTAINEANPTLSGTEWIFDGTDDGFEIVDSAILALINANAKDFQIHYKGQYKANGARILVGTDIGVSPNSLWNMVFYTGTELGYAIFDAAGDSVANAVANGFGDIDTEYLISLKFYSNSGTPTLHIYVDDGTTIINRLVNITTINESNVEKLFVGMRETTTKTYYNVGFKSMVIANSSANFDTIRAELAL